MAVVHAMLSLGCESDELADGFECRSPVVQPSRTALLAHQTIAVPAEYINQENPYDYVAANETIGLALYQSHCATCHGVDGRGDGPEARRHCPRPSDLHETNRLHGDGFLLWVTSEGSPVFSTRERYGAVDDEQASTSAMPSFDGVLTVDERWRIITTIRLHFDDGIGRER
ncbi:MAG: c-type cytochrome [Myxococcales bacterium]|nr:c-type cytochrome [Myxococcales bacterium]